MLYFINSKMQLVIGCAIITCTLEKETCHHLNCVIVIFLYLCIFFIWYTLDAVFYLSYSVFSAKIRRKYT